MAVVATAIAAALRWLLDPLLGTYYPFVLFLFATLFIAWRYGWRSAVATMILSYISANLLFIEPRGELGFKALEHQTGAAAYLFVSVTCILMTESRRRALQRAELYAGQLERAVADSLQAQEALRIANTSLEARVSERTRELGDSTAALQQSEAQYRLTAERYQLATSGGGTAVWEADMLTGRIDCDPIVMTWLGEPERPCPATIAEWQPLHHPDESLFIMDRFERHTRGEAEEFQAEHRLRHRDGSYRWICSRGRAVRDATGKALRCFGTIIDIHKLKLTELELQRKAAIIASSEDAIYSLDTHGLIVSWNPGAEAMFGFTAAEVLGTSPARLAFPDREDESAGIRDRVLHGKAVRQLETVRRHKDGKSIHVSLSATPLYEDGGTVTGAAVIIRDITQRRQLEEQIRQKQKMEAIGHLAGGVAHDFNNLLTVIIGYCEVLLAGKALAGPDADALREVKLAGERAAELTRQLLAFSRQQVLTPIVLNLNDIVRGMQKMLQRLIGEDIVLTCKLDPGLEPVKADVGQLEQVLLNLVINARDAMPRGGQLTLSTTNVDLQVISGAVAAELPPGAYALLNVSDTGHGIDEATKARIFEPFFTTKELGKGTGLGLATVHGIIKQSGGAISVYSDAGKGTTFKVYLPMTEERARTRESRALERGLSTGTETVLLVEDDEGIRNMTRLMLETQGYQVHVAADGRAALKLVADRRAPPDIVVTDVVMPHMDGPQLIEELGKRFGKLKVLYLSGYAGDALTQRGLLDGEMSFLQKPFSNAALVEKVRETLDTPSPT